jgi:proline dehydrogenase
MINRFVANIIPYLPKKMVWIFSKKYIAGEKVEDAIEVSKSLNSRKIKVTLDVLGEFITTLDEAEKNKEEYLHLIEQTTQQNVDCSYSLKPTSFGLLIDEEYCYLKVREVVEKVKQNDGFVRIDMEDSECVDKELELFKKLYTEYPKHVGIVLQAYLKRTQSDIQYLASFSNQENPINIRLCKGIYVESEEIAYKKRKVINDNFNECLQIIFENSMFPAIATHDKALIKFAEEYINSNRIMTDAYEYQMLYGVTPKLRDKIVKSKSTMRVYVPYGQEWFGYSTRRLKENPMVVTHILKSLLVPN